MLLLAATECTAIEVEALVSKSVAEFVGRAIEQVPLQISDEVLHRFLVHDARHLVDRLQLRYAELLQAVDAQDAEVVLPIDTGELSLKLLHRHLVIVGSRVALLRCAERLVGQGSLNLHHRLHLLGSSSLVKSSQLKHVHDMLLESLADGCCCLIGVEVILFLAQ